MQRNCGQNSQQILNWFAGEKQTENAGERNMNVKRAVHALIHTDTHNHTQAHTDTYICKWFYCPFVLLLFFLCFPPRLFLFASFGYATVYWYYYGTMLCNICKFLLLLPTTFFPEFPQLAQPPPCLQHQATLYPICPILTVLTFVGIIPHIVAAGVFVLFAFCSGSSSLLLLYNL